MITHELQVPGMSCDHCVATVERAVTAVDGVESVAVDLEAKSVRVDGGEEPAIRAALADAGYEAAAPA